MKDFFKTNRLIYCWNAIDFAFSERIISKLIDFKNTETEKKNEIITLLINSPGGSLSDAFCILDVMKNLELPIRTIAIGQVQSAAVMLLIAGTKNERYATKNTEFLLHEYSWERKTDIKYTELINRRKKEDILFNSLLDFYKLHTKLKEEKIKNLLSSGDQFVSSEEALKFGFIDHII